MLAPALTQEQVLEGIAAARRCAAAWVSVRPCDLDLAVRALEGSAVKPASVCGFPHGSATTAVKLYEARDLLRRGAKQIDAVIAISKLVSREFPYVQTELLQLAETCHKEGAILKVTLETACLTDELKIIGCRCCERAEVDVVKTSTGFGPGATVADLRMMRQLLPDEVLVEAGGGQLTLEDALASLDAGAARIASGDAAAMLDAWKARLAAAPPSSVPAN